MALLVIPILLLLLERLSTIDCSLQYFVPSPNADFSISQLAIQTGQQMPIRPQGFVLPLSPYSVAALQDIRVPSSIPKAQPSQLNYYPMPDYRNPGLIPGPIPGNLFSYPTLNYESLAAVPLKLVEAPRLPSGMVPLHPIGQTNPQIPLFRPMPVNLLPPPPRVQEQQLKSTTSLGGQKTQLQASFISQETSKAADSSLINQKIQLQGLGPSLTNQEAQLISPSSYFKHQQALIQGPAFLSNQQLPLQLLGHPLPNYYLPSNYSNTSQMNYMPPLIMPLSAASYPVVVNPQEVTPVPSITSTTTTATTRSYPRTTTRNPSWQYSPLPTFTLQTTTPRIFLPQTTRNPIGFLAAVHSAMNEFQETTTEQPQPMTTTSEPSRVSPRQFTFTFPPPIPTPLPSIGRGMTPLPLSLQPNPSLSLQSSSNNQTTFRFNFSNLPVSPKDPSLSNQITRSPPIILKEQPINRALEKLFMKKYNVGEKWRPRPIGEQPQLFQTKPPQTSSEGPVKIGAIWGDRLQGRPFVFPHQFNFMQNVPTKPMFHFEFPDFENPIHKSTGLAN